MHHEVGHFVDNDNDVGHFGGVRVILFRTVFLLLFHFFIIFSNFFNLFFGHLGVAAVHLADSPFHSRYGLSGIGNDWSEEVRNIIIGDHLDLLWVDDDETHIGRGVAIKERHNNSIGHDGFTRTSGTGDKEVWHTGEVGDDWLTRNVLTNGEGQWVAGALPGLAFENATKRDRGGTNIWHLYTDKLSTGDGGFDADGLGAEVVGKLFITSGDFAEVDTAGGFQSILGDARTDVGAFHLDFDAKLGEGLLDDVSVLLDIASVFASLLAREELSSRHFPVWVGGCGESFFLGLLGWLWSRLGLRLSNFGRLMDEEAFLLRLSGFGLGGKAGIDFDFELSEFIIGLVLSNFFTRLHEILGALEEGERGELEDKGGGDED